MRKWVHNLRIVAVVQMLILGLGATALAQNGTQKNDKQLEFSANPSASGIVYEIDGKIVVDPLRGLGKAIEEHGEMTPVVCLVDTRLPILVVGNVVAIAGKAGFKNVRSFVVDHNSGAISEIKFGPWTSNVEPLER